MAPKPGAELGQLNQLLSDRSYVGGGPSATADDLARFNEIGAAPDKKKLPHLARWYSHIAGLKAIYAPSYEWPAVSKPKKGRAAGKEKEELGIDCPVEKVENCTVPMENPPPLGAGSRETSITPDKDKYYITTAIHYSNGYPHIGHAYENTMADIFARYHRLFGRDVFFMTGNDEHGQKIAQTAEDQGMTPKALCDKHALGFHCLNQRLRISHDYYIRTTDDAHKAVARAVWSRCREQGDIYLGKYEGWYLVREERYVTDQEAEEWQFKDPSTGKPLDRQSEQNFHFALSKYQRQVYDLIKNDPSFVQPAKYRTELLTKLESMDLRDFSISRGSFNWGVPCPEDKVDGQDHVMYVWFDALINYVSGVNGNDTSKPKSHYWPADMHIVGKDITWFHAVYWPAMLMSAGLPVPKSIVVHGFVLGSDGRKMSKSFGNVVNPNDTLEHHPADSIRWYLSRASPFGDDPAFSPEALKIMHNADLADTLGNLVQRAVKLSGGAVLEADFSLVKPPFNLAELGASVAEYMKSFRVSYAADEVIKACGATNKWITELAPWLLKKEEEQALKTASIRMLLEAVYVLAHYFAPFIPVASTAIFDKLGVPPRRLTDLSEDFRNLPDGAPVTAGSILFQPFEIDSTAPAAKPAPTAASADAKAKPKGEAKAKAKAKGNAKAKVDVSTLVDNPDQPQFSKLDVRVGRIVKAWHHESADSLFVEEIDVGEEEPRQVVSGLRKYYSLEQFEGRRLLVVCNMVPVKLRGVTSYGMVLCAKNIDKDVVELLDVPAECNVGDRVLPTGVPATWEPAIPEAVKHFQVWESVAKELKTDKKKVACFQGKPLTTGGGKVRFAAPSQSDAPIA